MCFRFAETHSFCVCMLMPICLLCIMQCTLVMSFFYVSIMWLGLFLWFCDWSCARKSRYTKSISVWEKGCVLFGENCIHKWFMSYSKNNFLQNVWILHGVPFVSKLRFLVMFIKHTTFTKPLSIFTKHQSIFGKHRSISTTNGNALIFTKHRSMFSKGRGFDKHY